MCSDQIRILYVDDDPDQLEVVQEILETHFQIETSACPAKALDRLKEKNFDLLLTDVVMPSEDGVSLAKRVRQEHPNLGIIAISGGGKEVCQMLDEELVSVFFDFIEKPVVWDDFIDRYGLQKSV